MRRSKGSCFGDRAPSEFGSAPPGTKTTLARVHPISIEYRVPRLYDRRWLWIRAGCCASCPNSRDEGPHRFVKSGGVRHWKPVQRGSVLGKEPARPHDQIGCHDHSRPFNVRRGCEGHRDVVGISVWGTKTRTFTQRQAMHSLQKKTKHGKLLLDVP